MKDEIIIKRYFKVLWDLDRSDRSALTPNAEESLRKKLGNLEKMIDDNKLMIHPLYLELEELNYK